MSAVALGVGRGSPMVSNSADWLLRDEFISDLAAGSVNGTAAEPGPGTRVASVINGGTIRITGGKLALKGGNSSFSDALFSYENALTRTTGRVLIFLGVQLTTAGPYGSIGVHGVVGGVSNPNSGWYLPDGGPAVRFRAHNAADVGGVGTFNIACVLRALGGFYFDYSNGYWLIHWIGASGNVASLYVITCEYMQAERTIDAIRVPDTLWCPTPLASDGFGSAFGTTDGLGHAEGVAGGIGDGGSGKTWSNGGSTWSVSGGKAINTTPSGLSQQMSVAQMSTADVFASVALTRAAGEVGLALSMDSASSPANGVLVYLDGTNCKIDKIVGGSVSNVRTTAVTYSAGARLVVRKIGTEYRVYYNNAPVGAANTISDAGIVNNTLHGLFSTNASNTLDDFVCYATGTGGEYAELNKWS